MLWIKISLFVAGCPPAGVVLSLSPDLSLGILEAFCFSFYAYHTFAVWLWPIVFPRESRAS